ncbi:hypothetical protein [Terricaulis sp.]|uniref:hypothetical protein n=1 Tax=Terricaulis sp. TaxID=2768686 RepID=UPI002AC609D3|nr:hypothetical protein [Terricaulis sp.]MDZ4691365.1 hypothetical protein [Terricaulis sp.]
MLSNGFENWMVALFIFGAVAISMLGAGWSQWLEHKRRAQAMDIIKAALEAGREPPPILYEQLGKTNTSKPPWSEFVVFTALGFGFWIAYATADPDRQTAFLVIASTMTVTALGCLALALMNPGGGSKDSDDAA